jgi:hypothetical protein
MPMSASPNDRRTVVDSRHDEREVPVPGLLAEARGLLLDLLRDGLLGRLGAGGSASVESSVALVVWSVSPPRRVPSVIRTSNTPSVMAHQRRYQGVLGLSPDSAGRASISAFGMVSD